MGRLHSLKTMPATLAFAVVLSGGSAAADPFLFASEIEGQDVLGTNSFTEIDQILNPVGIIDALLATGRPQVAAQLDLRGLSMALDFQLLGPLTVLTVSIAGEPLITVTAANVDEAIQEFEDIVRGAIDNPTAAASDALTDILQGLLANSPVDPVAGNPNSLQTQMLFSDYSMGSEGPLTSGSERISGEDLFRIGLDYGYSKSGAWNVSTLNLPLGYRANFKNPKWSFLVDLPISATNTGGDAWSLFLSLGLGLQFRPFDWWAITPAVRIGGAGSFDVGALAILYGATVTSHIRAPILPNVRLGIVNTLGFNKSVDDITIRDINIAYDLTSGVFRNGGYIEGDFTDNFGWKFFGNDARFPGTDLFSDYSDEVGVGVQTYGRIGGRRYDALALTASYAWARQFNGLMLRLRWRF